MSFTISHPTTEDLLATIQARAQAKAVFMELEDREVTYQELLDSIRRTCGLFDELGLEPGQRIMIQSADDTSAMTLFLAALLDGLTPVLITVETQLPRARSIYEKAQPEAVFLDENKRLVETWFGETRTIGILARPRAKTGLLARLRASSARSTDTYPGNLDALEGRAPRGGRAGDDLACLVFTSGTTSSPKGVRLTHRNIFAHLATLRRVFGYGEDSRIFNAMILAHSDGLIQGPLLTAFSGSRLIRLGAFSLQNLESHLNRVHASRVTHFLSVPTVYAMIQRYAEHDDYFADPELRHVISVAAKIEPTLWHGFKRRFGHTLVNMYGLTETVTGGLFSGPGENMGGIGTIGKTVDIDARIVDPTTGQDVKDGAAGELWLRGDNVTPGYLDDLVENKERFHEDWLRTGDLARRREDGAYLIVGRIKSTLNSGGLLIRPEEIDEVLLMHPDIREAVTVGLDDPEWGEIPASAVVTALDDVQILAHCREHLERLKVPRRIVHMDSIPRGDAGKPVLKKLRELMTAVGTNAETDPAAARIDEREVIETAAATFKLGTETLSINDGPEQIGGWDSFGHLALITACEKRFEVKLSAQAVIEATTLRKLADALADAK